MTSLLHQDCHPVITDSDPYRLITTATTGRPAL